MGIKRLAVLGAALTLSACAGGPALEEGEAPAPATPSVAQSDDALLPPGFGTLRQDDVTLALRSGDLLIKATPLDEAIIRLTAPDTYDRLAGLARAHREPLERQAIVSDASLFLVSVFSYQPNVTYQPEDLNLVSRGLRERPLAIRAVTPGWGVQRLGQEETQMAVYAFDPDIDLTVDLAVEYQDARNSGVWERILSVIQAERAKVRARAGR